MIKKVLAFTTFVIVVFTLSAAVSFLLYKIKWISEDQVTDFICIIAVSYMFGEFVGWRLKKKKSKDKGENVERLEI